MTIKTLSDVTVTNSLTQAIVSLIEGIEILMNAPWEGAVKGLLASTSSVRQESSYTPTPGFTDAKKSFIRSEAYSAALLMSAKQDFVLDGKWLLSHLRYLNTTKDFAYRWCLSVYEDKDATEEDCELAYNTYQSYFTAVNQLRIVLDKIESREIEIKWKQGTKPTQIPNIPKPTPLNRKV